MHPVFNTEYPRISPLGAYLFLIFLDAGLFERGGLYEGGQFEDFQCVIFVDKEVLWSLRLNQDKIRNERGALVWSGNLP